MGSAVQRHKGARCIVFIVQVLYNKVGEVRKPIGESAAEAHGEIESGERRRGENGCL